MTPELTAHMIWFSTEPSSRAYVVTDPAGGELCRAYVADDPDRFRRLVTEQGQVGELIP